jgi:hypothetical protein
VKWEVVIGLETHVQLTTQSKIFSGSSTAFGAEPNTQASIVDLALPGALPVMNRGAVERAVKFGLAIGATINQRSIMARKNYFYPDLPKGYQISQFETPIVQGGGLTITLDDGATKFIELTRAHLEEDAGKSVHDLFDGASGVDLNRNFPTPGWAKEAPVYWEKRTRRDPRRWPGKAALSEPESRFLDEQIKTFKPQLILSIHAPYGVLDFDGPFTPPKRLGRLYLDQVGIFPGSLGNYGGVHLRIPVVTVELPSALRTPLDSEMRQMWLDLLRWMAERVPPGGTRRLGPRLPDSAQPD